MRTIEFHLVMIDWRMEVLIRVGALADDRVPPVLDVVVGPERHVQLRDLRPLGA